MTPSRFAVCSLLVFATGCTSITQTHPTRSATEEMLISTAADRAAAKLAIAVPPHTKVFVDGTNFEGTDSKYAMGAIRTSLLKQGDELVDDKKDASVIIEARAGALSTDEADTLFGIDAFNIPIPLASGPLPFPKIALYEDVEQTGVAKFALTGRDAKSGDLIHAQDPQYGFSYNERKTFLIFFGYTTDDAYPPGYKNGFLRDTEKASMALTGNKPTDDAAQPATPSNSSNQ